MDVPLRVKLAEGWCEMPKDLLKRFDEDEQPRLSEKVKEAYKPTFSKYDFKEKPSKSQRIENLPSDTALESNKERQDAEMKSGLKKLAIGLMPHGAGLLMAKEALSKLPKDEGETASGLPREARGKEMRFQVPERLRGEELLPKLKKGGKVSSASKRADGIAQRGKTRGKMV